MEPDDLCLLGNALVRSGNRAGGQDIWAQLRYREPNYAETLFELTLVFLASDRFSDAADSARALNFCLGWEDRAHVLLGTIQLSHTDPAGAMVAWRRALDRKAAKQQDHAIPIISRKTLARAPLQAGRPGEARNELTKAFAGRPDPELFWLLSRAHLQEGATTKALAAQEEAGVFHDEYPLLPEPAPFVGSRFCARCHAGIFHAQRRSRHARTFRPVAELGDLKLPPASFPDPGQPTIYAYAPADR
jgi:hypothetical protein